MTHNFISSSIETKNFKILELIPESCFNNIHSNMKADTLREKRVQELGKDFLCELLPDKKNFKMEVDELSENQNQELLIKLKSKIRISLVFKKTELEEKEKLKKILEKRKGKNLFVGNTTNSKSKTKPGDLIHKGSYLYEIQGDKLERFLFFCSDCKKINEEVIFQYTYLMHFENNEIDHRNYTMFCQEFNNKYASQSEHWKDHLEDKLIFHSTEGFQINIPDLSYELKSDSLDYLFCFKSQEKMFSLSLGKKEFENGEDFEFGQCVGKLKKISKDYSEASFQSKFIHDFEHLTISLPMRKQILYTSLYSLGECKTDEDYFTYVNCEFQFKIKFGKEFKYSNEKLFSLKSKEIEIQFSKDSLTNSIILKPNQIKFTGKISKEISFSAEFPQKKECLEKVDKILETFEFNSTKYKKNIIEKVSQLKFKE
jgi:hypothetical protein